MAGGSTHTEQRHMPATAEVPASTPRPDYPAGVPSKFDPDGNVQHFPGNTIISHLSLSSPLYSSLLGLHAKLERHSGLSHLYTLLPPSSWHMTIFEGVCDQVRRPGFWPADLPTDTPLATCTTHMAAKLAGFDLRGGGPPYRVSAVGFDPFEVGVGVTLRMRGEGEETRLRRLRDELSGLLLIRQPQHDVYNLHLSMAYLLRHLTPGQEEELGALLEGHIAGEVVDFELGAPEFCTFDDMFAFKRLFYIGGKEDS